MYATRAASETPVTPMMPHICPSISHASGYAREIYLSETLDGVLDGRVAQPQAHRAATLRYGSDPLRRHTQLLRQGRYRGRALRRARDNGSPLRLAEQEIDSRQPQAVRGEIDVETESRLVVRTAHGNFGERDSEAAVRAVVRRLEQAALRRRDEVVHQPPLSRQVHSRRLPAHEAVQHLPQLGRTQLDSCLA